MKWLTHFSLKEAPFSKEIGDAELWVPSSRARLVDELVETCHERGHILLTGEPGVGKTCVLRALRHRCLSPKATAAAVFYAIHEHVQQLGEERIHPVFLLDEARLLHQDVLEHLHILANHEWDARALLSIVLVGLPELKDRLALRKNRSLCSRIHTRVALGEACAADTAEYLAHRMRRAGTDREVFSSDAIALMHEASRGHLRDLDRIATACLKLAQKRKLRIIDRDIVVHVQKAEPSIDVD